MNRDRLRPLNAPRPVDVSLGADGLPTEIVEPPSRRAVETVRDSWRLDDEWWRVPIRRRYVDVILEGGGRMVLFEDLVTGEWFVQA